ncbi:hypothetical protein FAES_3295 [Fibrella aestuarina BUZ 2]|uniref:Uncharacterized protein n=1 Tax=Fibrella aestuarina BUZ 2 TaxID=1166018 RepID=I0KB00_9BACT|nr:hypothetical protein FAES_3295 [Fibrella aestuarina BUZ 2]
MSYRLPNLQPPGQYRRLTRSHQTQLLNTLTQYNQRLDYNNARRRVSNYRTMHNTQRTLQQLLSQQDPTSDYSKRLSESVQQRELILQRMREQMDNNPLTRVLLVQSVAPSRQNG